MNMLPTANVRLNRHDGTVASFVSLGRSRPDLRQVALDTPRTSTQISAERDAAQAEREAFEADRPDVLLNGTADDVATHDHRIALTKIRLDQLEVQHAAAVLAEAESQAAHQAEQKRRKELHRKAMKASAEVAALADQYVVEAKRLVPLLEKIRERAALIEAASFALPDGADPVPPGEPRCSWNGKADQPHSSIANRVKLPNPGNDTGFIWGQAAAPLSYGIVHDPR
ncbi:hypothetical protein ACRBEV_06220 [Methylobacterium phyllosphaerae]